jgi:hypothetical protein
MSNKAKANKGMVKKSVNGVKKEKPATIVVDNPKKDSYEDHPSYTLYVEFHEKQVKDDQEAGLYETGCLDELFEDFDKKFKTMFDLNKDDSMGKVDIEMLNVYSHVESVYEAARNHKVEKEQEVEDENKPSLFRRVKAFAGNAVSSVKNMVVKAWDKANTFADNKHVQFVNEFSNYMLGLLMIALVYTGSIQNNVSIVFGMTGLFLTIVAYYYSIIGGNDVAGEEYEDVIVGGV